MSKISIIIDYQWNEDNLKTTGMWNIRKFFYEKYSIILIIRLIVIRGKATSPLPLSHPFLTKSSTVRVTTKEFSISTLNLTRQWIERSFKKRNFQLESSKPKVLCPQIRNRMIIGRQWALASSYQSKSSILQIPQNRRLQPLTVRVLTVRAFPVIGYHCNLKFEIQFERIKSLSSRLNTGMHFAFK